MYLPRHSIMSRFAHNGFHSRAVLPRCKGKVLTKSIFVHRIRDLLQSGFQAHQYAGHSFRIGAAIYSSLSVHGRLHDPNTRQVAQCCFPQVRTPKACLASTSVTLVQQARTVHDVLCTLLSSSPHVVMVTHSHHLSVILV